MEFADNRLSHRRLMTPAIPYLSQEFFYGSVAGGAMAPKPGADGVTIPRERVMTRIGETAGILFPADGVTRRFRKGRGAQ